MHPAYTRPHSLSPTRETVRVVFAYKNFAAHKGISHIGLGVSCAMKARVLWQHGFHTDVWPIVTPADIEAKIREDQNNGNFSARAHAPLSHVVIAAPWIPAIELFRLLTAYPTITFVVICHSDVGFLQADPGAVQRLREMSGLVHSVHNFVLAGNNARFVRWAKTAFTHQFKFLPNLYDLDTFVHPNQRPAGRDRTIRIGCYGAARPLKNMITAAGAALQIATQRRMDVEFHVSTGREEGGHNIKPVEEMLNNPRTKLVKDNWTIWPEFVKKVGTMDLLMQPSYTESFNMVTADGVSQGVPSAVSETIDWVPPNWIARADDTFDLAKTGMALLDDTHAGVEGQDALRSYVQTGTGIWSDFLLYGN